MSLDYFYHLTIDQIKYVLLFVMATYPISTPVNFGGSNTIDFNSATITDFTNTSATGDIVYNDGSNQMVRLAIGSTSDVLTVSGGLLPSWAPASVNLQAMLARATGATNGIPTGDTWIPVANAGGGSNYITWSVAAPGSDAGSTFNTTSGVWTCPATGFYQFSAGVMFAGNAFGDGTITTAPSGNATRQARFRKTNATAFTIAFVQRQAEASSANTTAVMIPETCVSLTSGDTVSLQVRQDSGGPLLLEVVDGETWFSVHRCA